MPRRLLLVLAFIAAALNVSSVYADVIEARNVSVLQGDDALVVRADFGFDLTQRLEEALNHGVALYFVVEFELVRRAMPGAGGRAVQPATRHDTDTAGSSVGSRYRGAGSGRIPERATDLTAHHARLGWVSHSGALRGSL